jgi:hypothetical protein
MSQGYFKNVHVYRQRWSSSHRAHTVGTWLAWGVTLWPLILSIFAKTSYAQLVVDPAAQEHQRPQLLKAPNGVALVHIQKPSAAGVSHNAYSQFDVTQQGAILNNAKTAVQTQLGGWVQGNPGVWTLNDLWEVFSSSTSMHSCYGAGAAGCTQVENPTPGGPQGTPAGNAKLILFKGGDQVDRDGIPINTNKEGP